MNTRAHPAAVPLEQSMSTHYEDEPKIRMWKEGLRASGCVIKKITPLRLIYSRRNELLFALLDTDIRTAGGYRLPNIALVRGNACVVVALLHNTETSGEKFLMIRQWRTGSGMRALEFPAGMLDREVEDPAKVAAKELSEETGLAVPPKLLVPLNDIPLHTSAGLQDEAILYYGCRVELGPQRFRSFEGASAGAPHEGESIEVTLRTREEAEAESTSLQVHLGFHLFEKKFGKP
jgi:ADP-sugar diphosphatase